METIGSRILSFAKRYAVIEARVLHQIETITDNAEYTDQDKVMAGDHLDEANNNKRQQTDAFLIRVNSADAPADPVKEIMRYLNQGSHGVINNRMTDLVNFITGQLTVEAKDTPVDPPKVKVPKPPKVPKEKKESKSKKK